MKRCNFTGVLCTEGTDEDYELCGCKGECDECDQAIWDEEED